MWKIIVIKYEHGHGDPFFPTLYCAWVTFHIKWNYSIKINKFNYTVSGFGYQ